MFQFDTFVSIGEQCKTAYQLRRYSGMNASNIFDWLATPAASLLALIESDFDGFFQIDNLKVRADGNGVEDFATGVIFHGCRKFCSEEVANIRLAIRSSSWLSYKSVFPYRKSCF